MARATTYAPLPEAEQSAQLRKAVIASTVGTTIEWYDFFLYGTAAGLVFGKLFFPNQEPLAATLAAFGTYFVGFAARPIGAAIFGHYGDRIGRKATLIATLLPKDEWQARTTSDRREESFRPQEVCGVQAALQSPPGNALERTSSTPRKTGANSTRPDFGGAPCRCLLLNLSGSLPNSKSGASGAWDVKNEKTFCNASIYPAHDAVGLGRSLIPGVGSSSP